MRIKALLSIGLLLTGVVAMAQETSSARSNEIQLAFKSAPAKITWISPEDFSLSIKEKVFTVEVGMDVEEGVEIQSFELYVNDIPAQENRGFKKGTNIADRFSKFLTREVALRDGINTLRLVVTNNDGTVTEDARSINKEVDVVAQLETEARRDYALVFGINEYDEWNGLTNPVFDATTIAKELEESYGFEVDLVLNAEKSTIEQKLVGLYDRSYLENDQVLIFYAGHGQFDERTTRGFLVPKDGKLNDPVGSSYLSYSNVRDLVDNIPAKHVMLMLDACFGGTFDQDIARAGSRGQDNADMASRTEFIQRKLKFRTRMYVTSGGKEYVKDGRPGHHSPFAKQFLAALRDYGGADGILTKSELKSYMEVLAQMPRMGDFGTYEPGSDFIFIAR